MQAKRLLDGDSSDTSATASKSMASSRVEGDSEGSISLRALTACASTSSSYEARSHCINDSIPESEGDERHDLPEDDDSNSHFERQLWNLKEEHEALGEEAMSLSAELQV